MKKQTTLTTLIFGLIVVIGGLSGTSQAAEVKISDMPDYHWWYGCTPTSVGMIMGYYDRNGYSNLIEGGVAPLTTYATGSYGYNQDLSASSMVANNAIASSGHIHDFYSNDAASGETSYNVSGDDGTVGYTRDYSTTEKLIYTSNPKSYASPTAFDSIADYLGTNQDVHADWKTHVNPNGSSSFINIPNNTQWTPEDYINATDGTNSWGDVALPGIEEWIVRQGYEASIYHQATDNMYSGGFSFADFMNEIDNDRPVVINVVGHSMVGYGYDDSTNEIFVRDTWREGGAYDGDTATGTGTASGAMVWGGTYDGMSLASVVVIQLGGAGGSPEPEVMVMMALLAGGLLLIYIRNNNKAATETSDA